MSTTHTPPPWRVHVQSSRFPGMRSIHVLAGTLDPTLAPVVAHVAGTNPDAEANGRLIAAAPELLDALRGIAKALEANPKLRDVLVYSEGTHGDRLYPFDAVASAIARAEGQP